MRENLEANRAPVLPPINIHLVDSRSGSGSDSGSGSSHGVASATRTRQLTGPRLTLDEFCARFTLSDDIKKKLTEKKITGPHALRFISDEELQTKLGLEIGELADLRDAQEQWSGVS